MPKYSRIERERRYLLDHLPEALSSERRIISDLYVKDSSLRLRKMDYSDGRVEYKLGQKRSIDPLHREMTTLYLTESEFHTLESLPGRRLVKERYPYKAASGATYEINVFHGVNEGLVIAEIEFDTDEELLNPPAPPNGWVEISQDANYDGVTLAN